ncbi:hypothetical protein [Rheinheimera maricola]|uniref:DUF2390 domain-containing protein n=1 Tax=Rheinheimera maricola TaxID=2793282 RepID=A0ABS7XB35_9GAMM|nr:hypothetical protein [Rheinheimera maricola]MBZ9611982.1 hypothetical protein [Rheinheimera maricola]
MPTLFDETQSTAIHLIRVWQLCDTGSITTCLLAEDFTLEHSEILNRYSTLLTFSKFQLPVWVRLINQTQVDIERFAADGLYLTDSPAKWQLDIAIPVESVRLLHALEQALLALTAEQPDAFAKRIIVRPYQAIWQKLDAAKKVQPYNRENVQQLLQQLEQDAIRWLTKADV